MYVVDAGKVKETSYDPLTESTCLDTVDISRACAKQRSGRAGRVCNGFAYRLYSTEKYEKMSDYTTPDMLRMSLLEICLKAKLLANGSIETFLAEAIQPPSQARIRHSIDLLIKISALTPEKNITQLGKHLAHMPIDCQMGKMILYSVFLQCLDPVLTIASSLSVKSIHMQKKKSDTSQSNYIFDDTKCFSDHQKFLMIYETYTKEGKKSDFYKRYKISKRSMQMIDGLRNLILQYLKMTKYIDGDISKYNKNASKYEIVKSCILAGMYRKFS